MGNIFITQSNKLKNRFDPFFYSTENPILKGINIFIKDIAELVVQGPNPTDWVNEGGILCLKTKNVYDKGLILQKTNLISKKEYENLKRFTLHKNDILVTLKGFGSIGKVSIFNRDVNAIFTR